jgi:hypothetical protein
LDYEQLYDRRSQLIMSIPNDDNNKISYHIPQVIEEQIALAEAELADFEKQYAAQINFRRGGINALQLVRNGKPMIEKIQK